MINYFLGKKRLNDLFGRQHQYKSSSSRVKSYTKSSSSSKSRKRQAVQTECKSIYKEIQKTQAEIKQLSSNKYSQGNTVILRLEINQLNSKLIKLVEKYDQLACDYDSSTSRNSKSKSAKRKSF